MNKNYFLYIFFGIVSIICIGFLVPIIFKLTRGALTNFESGVFAIVLTGLGVAISMLGSMYFSEKAMEKELKTYGKIAIRGIVQSIKASKTLFFTILSKKKSCSEDGFPNKESTVEFFDNILTQTNRLTSVIFDSREDWRDILKDEQMKVDEVDREYAEISLKLIHSQEELKKAKNDAEKEREGQAEYEDKIKKLEAELEETKEDLIEKKKQLESMSYSWPSSSSLSATAASLDLGVVDLGPVGLGVAGLDSMSFCGVCGNIVSKQCPNCGKPVCDVCSGYLSSVNSARALAEATRLCPHCGTEIK